MRVKIKNTIYNADFVTRNGSTLQISIPHHHLFVVISAESDEESEMIFNCIMVSGYCDVDQWNHTMQCV